MRGRRIVSVAAVAQTDLDNIAAWTAESSCPSQAQNVIEAVLDAIDELTVPKSPSRGLVRGEIAEGMRTPPMRKRGRRGCHFLLYPETADEVKTQRVLHGSM